MQRQIPCTLICDSMAAQVMREGRVQAVFVGADRITPAAMPPIKLGLMVWPSWRLITKSRFYVAAPSSTFDLSIVDGHRIPIEQRKESEITEAFASEPRLVEPKSTIRLSMSLQPNDYGHHYRTWTYSTRQRNQHRPRSRSISALSVVICGIMGFSQRALGRG